MSTYINLYQRRSATMQLFVNGASQAKILGTSELRNTSDLLFLVQSKYIRRPVISRINPDMIGRDLSEQDPTSEKSVRC